MTNRTPATLLACWLVLALGPLSIAQTPSTGPAATTHSTLGVVAGRIIDQTTGEPLENARVVLTGTSLVATSDRSGYFTLRSVPPGEHVIAASYTGFETASRPVQAAAGRESTVRIELTSGPIPIGVRPVWKRNLPKRETTRKDNSLYLARPAA